ncbi:MAG TPA: DUF4112 domain-containing protein [Burkholderiales bacterium]|nr:DUF4112 domain-containing protein [Burkholderiales bacterium]
MKPPVTRIRQLTPRQVRGLEALRNVAQMLDSAFVVPGTSYRFGLDPILGLVPGLGDLVSPLFTIGILWQARELALPRIVQLRMIFNVAIDSLVGAVPLLGDLFDFAWKANKMNLALLERHAQEERPASAGDWLFVILMVALVVLVAVIPFVIIGWLGATAASYVF